MTRTYCTVLLVLLGVQWPAATLRAQQIPKVASESITFPKTLAPVTSPGLARPAVATAGLARPGLAIVPDTTGQQARDPAIPSERTFVKTAPVEMADKTKSVFMLPIAQASIRYSYPLEASYGKTTHIIFPSKIVYVDLGSDGIIVDKVQPTENVLKIKANKLGFDQTTLVVITEEGKYYPFLVDYHDSPSILHLNMAGNVEQDRQIAERHGVLRSGTWEGITLSGEAANSEEIRDLSEKVLHRKRFIKDIGVAKMRMSFTLEGVYIDHKILFFQVRLENRSEIDYAIDFFKFFIKDREVTRRMAFQELELPKVQQYPASSRVVPHKGDLTLVFALPMVSYGEDKVLELQVYEDQGGRHLRFELDSDVIIRAKGL